ncbi:MAG: tyrosine-type recombinase/integrase [Steroidobacteraceae bacterium]
MPPYPRHPVSRRPLPPPGKLTKLTAGDGLYLLIQQAASGEPSRSWRLKFRFGGKESTLSFGPYPDVPIEVAREQREAREAIATDAAMTFGRVGGEYLRIDATKPPKTAKKHQWLFDCLRRFHNRPLSSIQTAEIVQACRVFEAQGKSETAHPLAAFAARVYRYATQSGYTTVNPARDLAGALKPIIAQSREGDHRRAKVRRADARDRRLPLPDGATCAAALGIDRRAPRRAARRRVVGDRHGQGGMVGAGREDEDAQAPLGSAVAIGVGCP